MLKDNDYSLDFSTVANKVPVKSINIPMEINEGILRLTQIQYLLLNYVFAHVSPSVDNILQYIVDVRSFKKAINNNTPEFYDNIKGDIESFWSKTINTKTKEEVIDTKGNRKIIPGWRRNRFLRSIEYKRDQLVIDMLFEEKIFIDILSNINKRYIKTDNILPHFHNFYQTRLYTILNQIRTINSIWNITYSKLLERLGFYYENDEETDDEKKQREIDDSYYTEYKRFKSRILNPCINIINESAPFNVVVEEKKKGKSINQLIFRFSNKNDNIALEQNNTEDPKTINVDIPKENQSSLNLSNSFKDTLLKEGITPQSASYWLKAKGEEYCKAQFEYVKSIKTPLKKGFAAYFVQSCKDNYAKIK